MKVNGIIYIRQIRLVPDRTFKLENIKFLIQSSQKDSLTGFELMSFIFLGKLESVKRVEAVYKYTVATS